MNKTLISAVISLALSAALWTPGSVEQFAVYVLTVFNFLTWLCVLCDGVKGDAAAVVREHWPVSVILEIIQVGSLIVTGHPMLAASSFVVSITTMALAFGEKRNV